MAVPNDHAPPLGGILETALYVDDMPRARAFYEGVLGLHPMVEDSRLVAYPVASGSVLLLFQRGRTREPVTLPGGVVPPHDGSGPLHMAFAIPAESLQDWRSRLDAHGIAIESRVAWPKGGTSLYFRDPDGHALELATPGLWANY
jgi:catechol 2,3-dioxygenase-like lactoylglutathione lyase family enzyme